MASVGLEELGAGDESWRRRRRDAEQGTHLVGRLSPVVEHQADVGEGVTECADLPVEDGGDRASLVEHGVVESVVAVDDRRTLLGRDPGREAVADLLDQAVVVGAVDVHLFVLGSPATQLAFQVPVVAGEVSQPRSVDIDVVQARQRRGEVLADGGARGFVEVDLGLLAVTQDVAVDEFHHVEGRGVD